jgi:hypothetical protein
MRSPMCAATAVMLILLAACVDTVGVSPAAKVPGGRPSTVEGLYIGGDGAEYEWDTGDLACPATLNSHVRYPVRINAVGDRWFTFYAPHVRRTYRGGGKYLFRMTVGKSDDGNWMAEGDWEGRCIGFGQWGIGKVTGFHGTIWAVGGGDGECGAGLDFDNSTYESGVYSPPPVPTGCGSGTGSSAGSSPLAEDEWYAWYEGIRFRCHRVDDNTGGNIISCTVDE